MNLGEAIYCVFSFFFAQTFIKTKVLIFHDKIKYIFNTPLIVLYYATNEFDNSAFS